MSEEIGFANRNTRLSEIEVRRRLGLYEDSKVTDEIYSFGSVLVDKTLDRFKSLDTKAAAIAAYAIGIITVLASRLESWSSWFALSIGIAFLAAVVSVWSLLLKQAYEYSQDEWLNEKHLSDVEALRRYHVINMWGVIDSHQEVCEKKATRIVIAEVLLLMSALILVIAVLRIP